MKLNISAIDIDLIFIVIFLIIILICKNIYTIENDYQ